MCFAGLVIMAIVLNACPAIGGCEEALLELLPCASFVLGPGTGDPGTMCCAGIKLVVSGADTTEKRRSLCQCLKDKAVGSGVKVDPAKLKHIPDACGVKIPIPLDPNVDCST